MTKFELNAKKQFTSTADAAAYYAKQGREPLVLPTSQKRPKLRWKEPKQWTEANLKQSFSETANIGIALGERSGNLIDIDFDCQESAMLGKDLLSHLPSFGRAGSPYSHRVAIASLTKGRFAFQIPNKAAHLFDSERLMLLEIRGNGHQTMFPPSVHPSGELVRWHDDPAFVPEIDSHELEKLGGLIAVCCVIALKYPKISGTRDEICLALTGALVRAGFDDETVDKCIELVASIAGDEEAEKRGGKALATRAKLDAGEQVWGLPKLCEQLGISEIKETLRKWLGCAPSSTPPGKRPEILVLPGDHPEAVDRVEQALISAEVPIYQRFDSLVRPVTLPETSDDDGINRSRGALIIKNVTAPWINEQFAIVARWVKYDKDEHKIPVNPPAGCASAYLARVGSWKVASLKGICQSPTLRSDGTILQEPGYDSQSALLYDPSGMTFPLVPENPSKDDASSALATLEHPLREFCFAGGVDKSVALAAILTALVIRMFPACPLFAFDAPTAGTGKSLLAETLGIIATGSSPAMMSQGKSPEEDEKRLSSVLLAGDPIIVIDNCERSIEGDFLCSMLTQERVQFRILGKSEVTHLPPRCLVIVTGNNLELSGDMTRRALICRLDAKDEHPDLIQHSFDPRDEARKNRAELVVAGLTVLRAYLAAGQPTRLDKIGSFEQWNIVREALVWLGREDPADTRERILADDPQKGELINLLAMWWDCLQDQPTTLSELKEKAGQSNSGSANALAEALAGKTRSGVFNTKSIGKFLRKHVDRIAGGFVLRAKLNSSSVKQYWVVNAAAEPASESLANKQMPF